MPSLCPQFKLLREIKVEYCTGKQATMTPIDMHTIRDGGLK